MPPVSVSLLFSQPADGGSASRNLTCPRGSILLGLQNSQQRPRAIRGVGDLVTTLLSKPLSPPRRPHSSCAFIQVLLSEHLTPSAAPPPSGASPLGLSVTAETVDSGPELPVG